MKRIHIPALTLILLAVNLNAQWLSHRTPGIPRTPEGRPDMAAPAPRTPDGKPDLSGMWRIPPSRHLGNMTWDLKPGEIQPWAQALSRERQNNLGNDYYGVTCLPAGPNYSFVAGTEGLKIVQTPGLIVILSPDLTFRQVFMDGRSLEDAPNPTWMGYSVGHWEGDTLLVESNGYNDRSSLDIDGHPHSEALRMTERFHRTDFGHIELDVTFDDPTIYAKPMRANTTMQAVVDTELLEYVCAENEKDHAHLIGKASDDPTVELAPEILSKYVGTYDLPNPGGPGMRAVEVTLTGSELSVDHPIFGRVPLRAIGETTFSTFGTTILFVEEGGVKALIFRVAEGDLKATRRP
jgi:hypothetical protein